MPRTPIRQLAYLLGTLHNVTYYSDELTSAMRDRGIRRFWHGYMAYRTAPMGQVTAPTVSATFYNFAPALVAAAVPSVWEAVTPAEAMTLRDAAVGRMLSSALESSDSSGSVDRAAELALAGIEGVNSGARPLFAAHAAQPTPADAHLRLWHAATLWREFRGDGHNLALASAGLDGIECHVILAGKGIADQPTIERLRGWSPDEWELASDRLRGRGLISGDGRLTEAGHHLRDEVEAETDRLAEAPLVELGPERAEQLIEAMEPVVAQLIASGAVPGRWPPPAEVVSE